jgi:hypothetical protein
LFPSKKQNDTSEENQDAETSNKIEGKILLTTSPPKPPSRTVTQFLNELTSFFGGPDRVECRPRKDSRWDLRRIVNWSEKRGYKSIIILGLGNDGNACTSALYLLTSEIILYLQVH